LKRLRGFDQSIQDVGRGSIAGQHLLQARVEGRRVGGEVDERQIASAHRDDREFGSSLQRLDELARALSNRTEAEAAVVQHQHGLHWRSGDLGGHDLTDLAILLDREVCGGQSLDGRLLVVDG
jgi:hypothetical protein